MKLKIGDIFACHSETFISSTIRMITHSKYSHIAIVVSETELIEADGITNRIRYRNINYYKNKADVYTCNILTDKQRQNIVKFMQNSIGEKYDYTLLIWLAVKYIFEILLPFIDNTTNKICSEIVNDAYDSVGCRLCVDRWPTPSQIAESNMLVKIGEY